MPEFDVFFCLGFFPFWVETLWTFKGFLLVGAKASLRGGVVEK